MRKNITIYTGTVSILLMSYLVFAGENKVNLSTIEQVTEKNISKKFMHNKTQYNKQIEEAPEVIKKSGAWSDVFKPSEKIDADSVISFPVDI
jgi:hypothetical protein